jgi:hypothetical protein
VAMDPSWPHTAPHLLCCPAKDGWMCALHMRILLNTSRRNSYFSIIPFFDWA